MPLLIVMLSAIATTKISAPPAQGAFGSMIKLASTDFGITLTLLFQISVGAGRGLSMPGSGLKIGARKV